MNTLRTIRSFLLPKLQLLKNGQILRITDKQLDYVPFVERAQKTEIFNLAANAVFYKHAKVIFEFNALRILVIDRRTFDVNVVCAALV